MSAAQDKRRGFCPRVWTPMESGDGFILRVHPGTRWLTSAQTRALVVLSHAYGSGHIELTRRANLQLRGIRIDAVSALQAELVNHGLADRTAAAERRFVLIVTPLAGLVSSAEAVESVAESLERRLIETADCLPLHTKFCIAVDGLDGALHAVDADIRFTVANPDHITVLVNDSDAIRRPLGTCDPEGVPSVAMALLEFVAGASPDQPRRMHQILETTPIEAAREAVRPWLIPEAQGTCVGTHKPASLEHGPGGALPLGPAIGVRPFFGLGIPFGSGSPEQWERIATLAEQFGEGQIRIATTRGVLIPLTSTEYFPEIDRLAAEVGLITRPQAPLSRVIACTGAPGCRTALGETRSLARELSIGARVLLEAGATMHVSGCNKSCAHSGRADITVLLESEGTRVGFNCDVGGAENSRLLTPHELRESIALAARKSTR